jgi:RND family efflux transporter MFP subunit
MEDLARAKVIDTQTREETLHQLRASQATLEEAEAKVQTCSAMGRESAAKRDKAAADLEAAKNRRLLATTDEHRVAALLAYAVIKAPFDGVVSERHVHTGHLLQVSAGTGEKKDPLFVVVRTDRVRVFLDVPEADAVLVRPGISAKVRIQVLNDREFTGRVTGSSWSLEGGQRTLRTEVDLDNPEELLRPGMYAHSSVPIEHREMFSVPEAAVVIRDGQTFCLCAVNNKAVKTLIRTGVKEGSNIEVLKKLTPSSDPAQRSNWQDFTGQEQVIVTNPSDLTDGQPLQVQANSKS